MIYAENILLCIATPLLLSLLFVRGQVWSYVLAFVAGMLACLLAAYVTGFLRLLIAWDETEVRIFLSPVVEEITLPKAPATVPPSGYGFPAPLTSNLSPLTFYLSPLINANQ